MTKVATLAEAVASIPNGSHVALSGFATARCSMPLPMKWFARAEKPDGFAVRRAMDAICWSAGAVERIIYGGVRADVRPAPVYLPAIEAERCCGGIQQPFDDVRYLPGPWAALIPIAP